MTFQETYAEGLRDLVRLSHGAGCRADYVQGGGGNTSVKLDGTRMAVKASGFCLRDVDLAKAYAVLDYGALRDFYLRHQPGEFDDVERAGAEQAKAATLAVEGLPSLRPSVEAGFHSILDRCVLHTHSVYANLACCAKECGDIAREAFRDAGYAWGLVPYTDPGARLTFVIREELRRVEAETGRAPSVILLQNHGILVHGPDVDTCLQIHADANGRLAARFGLRGDDFPQVRIRETAPGCFVNDTPYLREALAGGRYTESLLLERPLYPDQLVFLTGSFSMGQGPAAAGQCVADPETGAVTMAMDAGRAQVMAETLTAVTYIIDHIRQAGYTLSTMDEAAQSFIAGWESEAYRKSLAGREGTP